jgi:hypothetical protein
MKKKTYTNKEIADELGLTLQELMDFLFEHGLIDENGMPTDFTIKNGFVAQEEINLDVIGPSDPTLN